jgi:CheY-like chemotaxis protein
MANAKTKKTKPAEKSKGNILLVDDERDIRESYSEELIRCGYSVSTAPNAGIAAIKVGGAHDPDVIVLDLKLTEAPVGQDGFDVLAHFWDDEREQIPIIIHSAFVGISGFMEKLKDIEEHYGKKLYASVEKSTPDNLIDVLNGFFENR